MADKIVAYKGFDKDWKCRDFQFEVGKTYEHSGAVVACQSGFHACKSPFDVWSYYGPFESKFARVTLDRTMADEDGKDTKIAAAKITVEAELSLPEFIKAGIDWLISLTKGKADSGYSAKIGSSGYYAQIGSSGYSAKIGSSGYSAQIGSSGYSAKIGSSGDSAQIGSSGYSAQIGSSGDSAKIGSSGYSAQIGSSGYYAQIGSSGDSAQIGSSGYSAQIGSSGDSAKIGSSGDSAQIGSSGDSAKIGSSGYYAQIDATGRHSVVAAAGPGTSVKGGNGLHIAIAAFDNNFEPIGFAVGEIGKNGLKPDTWYRADGLKLVEVKP